MPTSFQLANVSAGTDVAESQMYGSAFDCGGVVTMAISGKILQLPERLVVVFGLGSAALQKNVRIHVTRILSAPKRNFEEA